MGLDPKVIVDEIDALLREVREEETKAAPFIAGTSDEARSVEVRMYASTATKLRAAIKRYAAPHSAYWLSADKVATSGWLDVPELKGILDAIRGDIAGNRTRSVTELLHAETFADYLDMASHLLGEGYKDPAAVVTGSTLEAHLRALAAKLGVDPNQGDGKAKKTTVLVADLGKVQAFTKGDEKQLLAWLDLRNLAAHGHGDKFQAPQVALFIDGLRDFMRRVPA